MQAERTRQDFKVEKVAPGIAIVRNVNFTEASKFFRMMDAREIHAASKKYMEAFERLEKFKSASGEGAGRVGLYSYSSTLTFASKVSLGEYMGGGTFHYILDNQNSEKRELVIPEKCLANAGIDLNAENPLLIIHGGYSFESECLNRHNTLAVRIEIKDELSRKHLIRMLNLKSDQAYEGIPDAITEGWRRVISGIPAGKLSKTSGSEKRSLGMRSDRPIFGAAVTRNHGTIIGHEFSRIIDALVHDERL